MTTKIYGTLKTTFCRKEMTYPYFRIEPQLQPTVGSREKYVPSPGHLSNSYKIITDYHVLQLEGSVAPGSYCIVDNRENYDR